MILAKFFAFGAGFAVAVLVLGEVVNFALALWAKRFEH
jgi:hypothetical protein